MSRCAVALLATLLALPALPSLAHASPDALGARGTIVELETIDPDADTYLQFHGRVVIVAGTRSSEYRWGGTSCSNQTLSEHHVAMLQRALESATAITPRYILGQGSNKCLAGFTLTTP